MTPDLLKSLTPIYLGTLVFFLALVAVLAPTATTELRFAILGLGGSAIGAAGGLAQQTRPNQIQDSSIEVTSGDQNP